MKKQNLKFQELTQFFVLVAILVFVNIIASSFFFRLDLTEDKRFSISEASKNILKEIKSPVYVEVYLEGEFPAGFERLQKSIRETLEEFRNYSNNNIEYSFINPGAAPDVKPEIMYTNN